MKRSALALTTLMLVGLSDPVWPQTPESANLSPVDYAFIGSANVGNQFQIDTSKLVETHSGSATVRGYARLMSTSYAQVQHTFTALLQRINAEPPPNHLLSGAQQSLTGILTRERGTAFDRDYMNSQLDYQKANDALYRWEVQNGSNEDLKAFAQDMLPRISDHIHRAETLAIAATTSRAWSSSTEPLGR